MKYLVIEPHADDAFLSLGGHIEGWKKRGDGVTILTVFGGTRKRAADAQAYAAAVDAFAFQMPFVEDKRDSLTDCENKDLHDMIDMLADKDTLTLLPLGIKHPEHLLISRLHTGFDTLHYLDQPYAQTQSNTAEVNDAIGAMLVRSFLQPHARKYRHIPLFKDQSKFFHFNPAEKLKGNVEMLLEVVV